MIKGLIKSLRIRQWTKNIFVFAALVFDRQLPNPSTLFTTGRITNLEPFLKTVAGCLLFCLISSTVYILNDIADREADRNHPTKRNRPIASGKLPVSVAIVVAVCLLGITLVLAYILSFWFFIICLAYFILNVGYSLWWKHVPIIDVLLIATFFTLRVGAGVTIIIVERFSPWLYVVMMLLSLFIGFGKRRAELASVNGNPELQRKVLNGYTLHFLDQLIIIVSATTIVAYSMYTFLAINVPQNHSMMLTIPFVLYGLFRYLYLVQVKGAGGAPEEIALTDRPTQVTVFLWGISVLVIFYFSH
jgi:4-hydroxybenzoate polyprenyltransferase